MAHRTGERPSGVTEIEESTGRSPGTQVRGSASVPQSPQFKGQFGRMFRRLSPAPTYSDDQLQALAETMEEQPGSGGWNPSAPIEDGNNAAIAAGHTGVVVGVRVAEEAVQVAAHR